MEGGRTTKDAPAFDFYPERWTHGTRFMNKVERCDYLDLLLHQWTEDGLPADVLMLAKLCGYKKAEQLPAIVLEKFPVWVDGKRRNNKLELERQKQRERIAKHRRGALITNAKRTAERPAERINSDPESVTPPPTTHHIKLSPVRGDGWPELSEVVQEAERVMAPPDCAESFFNEMEGVGWINKHGHPLTDWRPLLWNYATRWKNIEFRRKQNGNQQPQQRPTMQL